MDARGSSGARKIVVVALAVVVLAAAGIGAWLLLGGGSGAIPPGPEPLVESLEQSDWKLAADPETGYRRLSTPFREGTSVDGAALGPEGTVAVGLRSATGEVSLLVWRPEPAWRLYPLPEARALTALAVDPEGRVHAGTREGHLVRVDPDGELERTKEVVRSGYSVVGFAFDFASKRSAVMTAGGVVHTGMRPLHPRELSTVDMPSRARIRTMRYTADGDLVVAGDAGAVFASTDEGWDERTIPTSGRVVALGWDEDGALLAAQSNGHVFRMAGSTWDRVGQVPRTPVGVGFVPERGVVVAATDGSLFGMLGRDDFSEMPKHTAPSGLTVHGATVWGHDVLMAATDRLLVWDGAQWDSTDAGASHPEGTVPPEGCDGVGPPSIGHAGVPAAIYRCDERYAQVQDGALSFVDRVKVGGTEVAVQRFVSALHDVYRRPSQWIGGALWAGGVQSLEPVVERWEPSNAAWRKLVALDREARVESLSAARAGDGYRLWIGTDDGAVRTTMVAADATELGVPPVLVGRERFEQAWPEGVQVPQGASVYALGEGAAVVVHGRWLATRISADGGTVEPLYLWQEIDPQTPAEERPRPVPTSGFRHVGGKLLAFGSEGIREVPPSGAVRPWEVEREELQPLAAPVDRRFDTAATEDGTVYLLMQDAGLLRCREASCRPVALPADASPRGLAIAGDGTLVLEEASGVLAVRPPEKG